MLTGDTMGVEVTPEFVERLKQWDTDGYTFPEEENNMLEIKGSDEQIIEDFNSENYSVPQMAEKYNHPIAQLRSRIAKMQRNGLLGYKNRMGTVITQPGEPSPRTAAGKNKPKKEKRKYTKREVPVETMKMETLADMLKDANEEVSDQKVISTFHKELLIEVLHKIIC